MNDSFSWWRWLLFTRDAALFAEGFWVTLSVSAAALALSLAAGFITGLASSLRARALVFLTRVYIDLFQNIPLVIHLFFLYNALPYMGVTLPVFIIGAAGIGLYHGAYTAEAVRAGINAIPRGQYEAAAAQGFSFLQTMLFIILPQTVKMLLPPLANQAVSLIKNTSALAMIAGGDLMYRADSWASSGSLSYGPAYLVSGALYFALCFPLTRWARMLEERAKKRGGGG